MDDRYIFINFVINDGIILYSQYKDAEDNKFKENFVSCVIEMLCIIYGEDNIVNNYYNKDPDGLKNVITSAGYPEDKYLSFIDDFEKYYEMEYAQSGSSLKEKNKYFNIVQKHIVDMASLKNNIEPMIIDDRKKLYNLLFTANSKSFFKKTFALATAYNPYEIDDYFKAQGLLLGDF